ncbi:MAG: hypothetical protein LQ342_000257 [Letrouitia transgressa]|nr:MAG: hypothetical protein LQ342_000257 [Letrouitia transgressa]
MVYDVPRNFVGDTHWREPQPIQDGDELELEKGVLIQVGEEMAKDRAETDLTELLERGRNKNVALQGRHRPWGADGEMNILNASKGDSPAGSKGETNTSLRPKTLNALLGTSKGQLGRAALPTKSPAEDRPKQGNEVFENERPSKKRKLQYPAEEKPLKGTTGPRCAGVTQKRDTRSGSGKGVNQQRPQLISPENNSSFSGKAALPYRPDQAVVCDKRQPSRAFSNVTKKQTISKTNQAKEDITGSSIFDSNSISTRMKDSKPQEDTSCPVSNSELKLSSLPSNQKLHSASNLIIIDSDIESDISQESLIKSARLRIATRKPRRKLMYRDLLMQKGPQESLPLPSPPRTMRNANETHCSTPPVASTASAFERAVRPKEISLSAFHRVQHDRLEARLGRQPTRDVITEPNSCASPSPPLAIHWEETEENNLTTTEEHHRKKLPETENLSPPCITNLDNDDDDDDEDGEDNDEYGLQIFSPPDHHHAHNPPSVDPVPAAAAAADDTMITLSQMDALLLEGHQPSRPKQKQHRPLRRCLSHPTSYPAQHQQQQRTPVRKTVSDLTSVWPSTTTVSAAAAVAVAPAVSREEEPPTADPWSREALDLFGWDGGSKKIKAWAEGVGDADAYREEERKT